MWVPEPCEAHTAKASAKTHSRLEVANILRRFGPSYAQTHSVSPFEQHLIDDLIACRTATLGGHIEHCSQCGFERQAYNSCRNRHCPKCQTVTKMRWVEARRAELLPTPYFHTVVTLPHELNPLVLTNKRLLLGALFRSASETLLDFGRRRLGGQLGAIMVLHTWDQLLKPHVHLHALVPGGALAGNGHSWRPTHATFLFPVKALSTVFRAKYLDALRRLYAEQALRFTDATLALEAPTAFDTFVKRLRRKKWIVYAKPPFGGPEHTLSYLGRYTHRVAIANHRLLDMHGDQVRFTFRNRRQGDRVEVAQLEAHTFIKRFLQHVLPSGFVRVRHYGVLANRCKARTLPLCRQALGQVDSPPPPELGSVAQWMQRWTGIDITRCPACGHQPLERLPLPAALGANRNRDPPAPNA
jgi:predicted Zn-ribbon and HTH transcriptional regulator